MSVTPCPIHCLLTFLCLCLCLPACECPLFIIFATCWPFFQSISVCQLVSNSSLFLYWLLSHCIFLSRMWVPSLLILFAICWPLLLCLSLPGCECHPSFILFAVCWCNWPLSYSVIPCQLVSAPPHPYCLLLTSIPASPACECQLSFAFFAVCWTLFHSVFAYQFVSAAYLSYFLLFPVYIKHFVSASLCSSYLLSADLSCYVSACQDVNAASCLSCLLYWPYCSVSTGQSAPHGPYLVYQRLWVPSVPHHLYLSCQRLWVPPFIHLICCPLISLSLSSPDSESACQGVSHTLFVLFAVCWLLLALSMLIRTWMWILVPCLSHLPSADLSLALSLLTGCECCLLFILLSVCVADLFHSVSACQDYDLSFTQLPPHQPVSTTDCSSSCSAESVLTSLTLYLCLPGCECCLCLLVLFAGWLLSDSDSVCQVVSHPLFVLFTTCWPLTSVSTLSACECSAASCSSSCCLLISHTLCLHLLGCEYCPLLVLFAACQLSFALFLLARIMWVPPFINPVCCLLTFYILLLLASLWVLLLIHSIFCPLTPVFALQDCVCCLSFVFTFCWPISLCLCLPACECCI